MFSSFRIHLARKLCIEIAQDLTSECNREGKEKSLALVEAVLRRWKHEQGDADGRIPVDPQMLGILGDGVSRGVTLDEFSKGERTRAVSDLEPWECTDFELDVHCDADLFVRLAFNGYVPASATSRSLGAGIAVALLVERDGMEMPLASLIRATQHLWVVLFARYEGYRDEARRLGEKESVVIEQRLAALATATERKRANAANRRAEWQTIAAQIWLDDPVAKVEVVAESVIARLRERGQRAEDLPSARTVHDALKGQKAIVVKEIARVAKRLRPA